jgi:hypothetical protein
VNLSWIGFAELLDLVYVDAILISYHVFENCPFENTIHSDRNMLVWMDTLAARTLTRTEMMMDSLLT